MKKTFYLFFLISSLATAQVGIGTNAPDASSVLDVRSIDKGVLIPRVSLTTTTASAPIIGIPEDGLCVYNTTTNNLINGVIEGYYYWQNNKWNPIGDADNGNVYYEPLHFNGNFDGVIWTHPLPENFIRISFTESTNTITVENFDPSSYTREYAIGIKGRMSNNYTRGSQEDIHLRMRNTSAYNTLSLNLSDDGSNGGFITVTGYNMHYKDHGFILQISFNNTTAGGIVTYW